MEDKYNFRGRIPNYVVKISDVLKSFGHKTYLVGGATRDIIRSTRESPVEPKDYDLATQALPEEIHKIFDETNKVIDTGIKHLTVTILIEDNAVEITTLRKEGGYSDNRHPDEVIPTKDIYEDLARRNFTVNAIALDLDSFEIIDPYFGIRHLEEHKIICVGDPTKRLEEDRLRAVIAISTMAKLGFDKDSIDEDLKSVLMGFRLTGVSVERIRDEYLKILSSPGRIEGVELLMETKLNDYIAPEMYATEGIEGGIYHKEPVSTHSKETLRYCPRTNPLLCFVGYHHDIGKPYVAGLSSEEIKLLDIDNLTFDKERINGIKPEDMTFYSHDLIGSLIIEKVMRRLKFSNAEIAYAKVLIRWHLFNYRTPAEVASDKYIKRLVKNIGEENILDMIKLNWADRMGNLKKREYTEPFDEDYINKYTIVPRWLKIKKECTAFNVNDLLLNGNEICEILNVQPGPIIGKAKEMLFNLVEEGKVKNDKEELKSALKELDLK